MNEKENHKKNGEENVFEGIYDLLGKIGSINLHFGGIAATMKLIELLEIKKEKNVRILEIGSGTGFTSCYIANNFGCQINSIDLSEMMVSASQERAKKMKLKNVKYEQADALKLPFEENTFDIVYAESVTGVIPNRKKALKEYLRVLKTGGLIGDIDLFITPDAPSEVVEQINKALKGAIGASMSIPTLIEWRNLFESSELKELYFIENNESIFPSFKDIKKSIGTFGVVKLVFKLLYQMILNKKIRRMIKEARKIQKKAFIKEGEIYQHLGYLIFIGKKVNSKILGDSLTTPT